MDYQQLNEEPPSTVGRSEGIGSLVEENDPPDDVAKLTDVHLDGEAAAENHQSWGAGPQGEEEDEEEEEELNEGDTVTLLRDHREEDTTVVDEVSGHVTIGPGSVQITTSQAHKFKWVRYALGVGAFVLLFAFLAIAIALIAVAPSCDSGESPGNLAWWKTTVIYQCYPRSFQDSDGDGNGDLAGITSRANYFVEIGVKTVWLNPIFKSPQRDGGYDISNFTDVDPLYGTMDDFKALLEKLHSKGLKLLLDFVPNHTSDEHPWFLESRKSKNNPKRDWYVWANGTEDGNPPNNWISVFGGSAWTYDNATGQYYFHQFSEYQPDLNYRNPEVMDAMEEVLRFWLDLGVDGFRFDAVKHLLEDPQLRDEVLNPNYSGPNCTVNISDSHCYGFLVHNLTTDYLGIHNLTRSWRRLFDSYGGDRFMVGEIYDPVEEVIKYYGEDGDEFDFPFNFFLLGNKNWTGIAVNNTISYWLDNLPEGAWPNWVLGNHDNSRVASRVGHHLAKAMNVLLLTLPGTPITYYGEEIFMTDLKDIPDNRRHDTVGRDPERTPMQWNTSTHAGFTSDSIEPWLPLPLNSTKFNVEVERSDQASMLNLYKALTKLKSEKAAFLNTNYMSINSTKEILAYYRFYNSNSENFIVVVNFATSKQNVDLSYALNLSAVRFPSPFISLSSNLNRTGSVDLKNVHLEGGEALVLTSATSCG